MILTLHAEQRKKERHINTVQLQWLLCYAEESHNRGVSLYHFDRGSYQQLLKEVDADHFELALRSRNIYAIVVDEKVITVGYRDARLKPTKSHKRVRRGVPTHPVERRHYYRNR